MGSWRSILRTFQAAPTTPWEAGFRRRSSIYCTLGSTRRMRHSSLEGSKARSGPSHPLRGSPPIKTFTELRWRCRSPTEIRSSDSAVGRAEVVGIEIQPTAFRATVSIQLPHLPNNRCQPPPVPPSRTVTTACGRFLVRDEDENTPPTPLTTRMRRRRITVCVALHELR